VSRNVEAGLFRAGLTSLGIFRAAPHEPSPLRATANAIHVSTMMLVPDLGALLGPSHIR